MNNKVDKKQLQLIMLLFVVIILFGAFQLGKQFTAKKDEYDEQIKQLTATRDELDNKMKYRALYESEKEKAEQVVPEILNKYGPANTVEKSIMFVVNMSNLTKAEIATMSFGAENLFFSSQNVSVINGIAPEGVFAYTSEMTLGFNCDYRGLKGMIDTINNNSERMTIKMVNAAFDQETGNLTGTMVVNLYAITGTSKNYEAPTTGVSNFGTTNIFGTGN